MESKFPWRALIYAYLSMFAFAVTFQAIPPVLGFIISSLGISHTYAGALMSFFAIPGIIIAIPGGILSDIYGPRRMGIISLIISLVGCLLVGLGGSFSVLVAGRFISGIGALIVSIIALQTISCWFTKKDLGSAMGIFNTAMPVGTILSLNIFNRLAVVWGWRIPIILTAAFNLFILALYLFWHPGLPNKGAQLKANKPDVLKEIFSVKGVGWPIWFVAAIWMMFNAAGISFLTFASDYYISVGYDVGYAGFLASLFMIGSLVFSPLVGYLIDKAGGEAHFIIAGTIVSAILLYLVPVTGINPLYLGGLLGLSAAFIPTPVYSLVPKYLPPNKQGMGYGILSAGLNIGILTGPLLVGLSYDQVQNYIFGFKLMAIFSITTAVIALFLQLRFPTPTSNRKEK